jgi:transposase InsO family protein
LSITSQPELATPANNISCQTTEGVSVVIPTQSECVEGQDKETSVTLPTQSECVEGQGMEHQPSQTTEGVSVLIPTQSECVEGQGSETSVVLPTQSECVEGQMDDNFRVTELTSQVTEPHQTVVQDLVAIPTQEQRTEVLAVNDKESNHTDENLASVDVSTDFEWPRAVTSVGRSSFKSGDTGQLVTIKIGGKSFIFLVDTGSQVTILSPESYGQLPLENQELTETSMRLQAVNGTVFPVMGILNTPMEIGQVSITKRESFLIAQIDHFDVDGILGMDIMKPYKAIIDIDNNRLSFNGQWIPCLCGEETVSVTDNVIIEPHCARIIQLTVPMQRKHGHAALLEPDPRLLEDRGLLLARSIVSTDSPTTAMVIKNPGNVSVELKSGQIMGWCEPIAEEKHTSCRSARVSSRNDQMTEQLVQLHSRSSKHLSQNESKQLKDVLLHYQHAFAKDDDDLGRCTLVKHRINVGNARPIKQAPRRQALTKRETERTEVARMLQQGIIRPSSGPWASPTVLIKKKDGKIRFCIDYRELNKVTVRDAYPLPNITDCFDNLEGAKFFCTMDLQSGYWQLDVHPDDKEKTAFATRTGLYEFNVLPFGLTNAPATFERVMETVLRGLHWTECLVYLDDIIVFGRTFDETMGRLTHVLERLTSAGLKLKPSKCDFFQEEVKFLGHVVTAEGIKTQPEKVEAIASWPTPKSEKEVKSFLGLAGYYRRFIKDFAKIARPMTALTSSQVPFVWTQETDKAFCTLKQALASPPVLGYPKESGQMIIDTDASGEAMGAVISQIQDDQEVVLAYMSKCFTPAERNYCVTRKELFAVVTACRMWHAYVLGRPVIIRTDNSAVAWSKQIKKPANQMARWLQELATYDLHEIHRPGRIHWNADSLSRRPHENPCNQCHRENGPCSPDDPSECQNGEICAAVRVCAVKPGSSAEWVQSVHWCDQEIRKEQLEDPDIGPLLRKKDASQSRPKWKEIASESEAFKALWAQFDRLEVRNGLLVRRWETNNGDQSNYQLIVPRTRKLFVMSQMHDTPIGGHFGSAKTLYKIKTAYYWIGMRDDVRKYCHSCDECTARKPQVQKHKAPMKSYVIGVPMERVCIDIKGPMERTQRGNKYILVLSDSFTKWTEAYAMSNIEAKTVARKVVEEWVCRYGSPRIIHSDQGRQFESQLFKEMCVLLGIKKTRTTALRPQANGQVERFNRTLGSLLAIYCDDRPKTWDNHLPFVAAAYRAASHDTTGMSPNHMVFGKEVTLPLHLVTGRPADDTEQESNVAEYTHMLQSNFAQAYGLARQLLRKATERQKKRYDVGTKEYQLRVGQPVWLSNPNKHLGHPNHRAFWKKGWVVTAVIDDVTYRIQENVSSTPKVVHIDRLMAYEGRNPPTWFLKSKHGE